jgi:hypothetical protein
MFFSCEFGVIFELIERRVEIGSFCPQRTRVSGNEAGMSVLAAT